VQRNLIAASAWFCVFALTPVRATCERKSRNTSKRRGAGSIGDTLGAGGAEVGIISSRAATG